MRNLRELARDRKGATAVEYGLILALVFLAMIGGVVAFGNQTISMWTDVAQKIEDTR